MRYPQNCLNLVPPEPTKTTIVGPLYRSRTWGLGTLLIVLASYLGWSGTDSEIPGATVIPFDMEKDQILLPLRLSAGPSAYIFLLDTGVNPSGIDLALARELGLLDGEEPVGEAAGVGGDKVYIYGATLRGARLGGMALGELPAVAMDFSGLGKRLGRPLHGILGYSFFKDRIVRIDYPRRRVVVLPRDYRYEGDPAFRTPLVFVDNDTMPLLKVVEVNGKGLPLSLDTGSSLVVELYPEGAAAAEVVPLPGTNVDIAGARGAEKVGVGRARDIALGPLILRDCEVMLPPHRRPGNRLGNLGNGFLKHFVLTLDYVHGELIIEEPPPDPDD